MARTAWVISDGTDSYSFAINPLEGGSPEYTKTISEDATTAPDGTPVVYEGQQPLLKQEASGTLLTKDQYAKLLTWWKKRRVLQLTDDLGRVQQIILVTFAPKRIRSVVFPYKHTYNIRWYVLSMTDLDEM